MPDNDGNPVVSEDDLRGWAADGLGGSPGPVQSPESHETREARCRDSVRPLPHPGDRRPSDQPGGVTTPSATRRR